MATQKVSRGRKVRRNSSRKRITAKEVNRLGSEHSRLVGQFGSHDQGALRAMVAYHEALKAWEQQNPGRSFGVRRNPALLTYGNPGGRTMGSDVLAVLYRHADDGGFYCHGFGNADIKLRSRGSSVTIAGLKPRTGVKLICQSDGSLRLAKANTKLWEDM